jgi:hypothetical protein
MTINQAIDKLTNKKELTEEQSKLMKSLVNLKIELGGRTDIENSKQVENIITHGFNFINKDNDETNL